MSDPATALTGHVPEGHDHRELKDNGQQLAYVVLTAEERAKGFVRPYRESYVHVGRKVCGKMLPDEQRRLGSWTIDVCTQAPEHDGECGIVSTTIDRDQLAKLETDGRLGGCGTSTRMSREIAETCARNPKFYGGTFCVGCGEHLPLNEFVWEGTTEQVGS